MMNIFYAILILSPLEIKTMPSLEAACKTGKQVIEIQAIGESRLTANNGMNSFMGNANVASLQFRPIKCRVIVTPEKKWIEEHHDPEKLEWVAE